MPPSPSTPPDHPASVVHSSLCCIEDAGEVVHSDPETWTPHHPRSPFPSYSPPSDDDTTITTLIDSEHHFMPSQDYILRCRRHSLDGTTRQDSINWILEVHAHYHFSPVTALLSVNYFDRFLSTHSLPGNGWPLQLLSVACLSLACKMEEPHVPLLLDFQVLEPGFVFEPNTVQRMELLVMSILNWRLRSVTPFDFLHHFISTLPSISKPFFHTSNHLFKASSDLILRTTRVIDFLGFSPSTVAAAAVMCVAGETFDETVALQFHERVNKEMVRSCRQLMEEYLIDTCPSGRLKDVTAEPPSPVGVLDAAACGSCATRTENPGSSSQAEAEALAKRLRSSAPDVQQP